MYPRRGSPSAAGSLLPPAGDRHVVVTERSAQNPAGKGRRELTARRGTHPPPLEISSQAGALPRRAFAGTIDG